MISRITMKSAILDLRPSRTRQTWNIPTPINWTTAASRARATITSVPHTSRTTTRTAFSCKMTGFTTLVTLQVPTTTATPASAFFRIVWKLHTPTILPCWRNHIFIKKNAYKTQQKKASVFKFANDVNKIRRYETNWQCSHDKKFHCSR